MDKDKYVRRLSQWAIGTILSGFAFFAITAIVLKFLADCFGRLLGVLIFLPAFALIALAWVGFITWLMSRTED